MQAPALDHLDIHPHHVAVMRRLPATCAELDRDARHLPELIHAGLVDCDPFIYDVTLAGRRLLAHTHMPDTRRVERPGPRRQPLPAAKTGTWWDVREEEDEPRALKLASETGLELAYIEEVGRHALAEVVRQREPEYLAAVYRDVADGLDWLANEDACDAAGVP